MKKIVLCLAILLYAPMVLATEGIHLGLDLGMLKPHDDLVTETFSDDFYIDGFIGYESEMGLELRLGVGNYSEYSHHPADEGLDTKLTITPLHVDLIYNFSPLPKIRPFLGGGLGTYFYKFSDNFAGSIESGTVFVPSLMAGVKYEFNELFSITAKYARHFIPAIPEIMFNDSNDFESSVFTIGFAVNLTPGPKKRTSARAASPMAASASPSYRYNETQENILVRIDKAERKLQSKEMEMRQIDDEINTLSKDQETQSDSADSSIVSADRLSNLKQKRSTLEKEIAELKDELEFLHEQWDLIAYDGSPVVEHIYYLRRHCSDSPWGLRCRNGHFYYSGQPYAYGPGYFYGGHYHHHHHPPDDPHHHGPSDEERLEHIEKRKEHIQRYKDRKPISQEVDSGSNNGGRKPDARQPDDNDRWKKKPPPAEPDKNEKKEHIDRYRNRRSVK